SPSFSEIEEGGRSALFLLHEQRRGLLLTLLIGKKEPEQWRSALLLPSEKGEERVSAPPPASHRGKEARWLIPSSGGEAATREIGDALLFPDRKLSSSSHCKGPGNILGQIGS
ncbi:unnamed protein product, partial [Musa hybrid cultivar]